MKAFISKIRQNLHILLLLSVMAAFYLTHGCPLRFFFGICCPGCGMSRALLSLLRLDFALAIELHPLVLLLPVAVIIYLLRRRIPKKVLTALCIFALALMLAVYIVRLGGEGNVVYADFKSGLIYKFFSQI